MARKTGRPETPGSETRSEAKAADSGPENAYRIGDPAAFAGNLARVAQQSQKLISDFVKRQSTKPLDPLNLTGAFSELLKAMSANPAAIVEAQFQLWRDWMGLWERSARRM